jgi:hypothetical protein
MLMENISRLLLKPKLSLPIFRTLLLQEKLPWKKRLNKSKNKWQTSQHLQLNRLSKEKVMVIWKQLKKLKVMMKRVKKKAKVPKSKRAKMSQLLYSMPIIIKKKNQENQNKT